jgi:hypothetical protein
LHLMGFEAKEGEAEKELVQRFNIELLQGQWGCVPRSLPPRGSRLRLRGPPPRLRVRALTQCCSNSQWARTTRLRCEGARAWQGQSWAWTTTSRPRSKCASQSYGRCSRRPRPQASAQPNFSSMALGFARPPLSKGAGTKETYAWYYETCMGVV